MRWLLVVVVALAGCAGAGHPAVAPTTTAPATVALTACQAAAVALTNEVVPTYGGLPPASAYNGTSPFYRLLVRTLNDCASREEWLGAMEADTTGTDAQLGVIFDSGCAIERMAGQVAAGVGTSSALPQAC